METTEALASHDWLNISSESILEFLNMECLNIKEADLVRALIRWGKFQLQQQDRDHLDENLRSKILPGLQKIRYDSLNHEEIVKLYQEELGEVLSDGEKCSILMSIISGNWGLMPNDVVPSTKLAPRPEPYTFCSLPYAADKNENQLKCGNKFGQKHFYFKVDKNATPIVGIKLNLTAPYHKLITFSLHHYGKDVALATGSVNITSLHRDEFFCPFNTMQTLIANTEYRIDFQFDGFDELDCHHSYVLQSSVCDGLNLTRSDNLAICVHILGVIFSKAVDISV
jgi:hypothetical protein